jgi:hypothetical protein
MESRLIARFLERILCAPAGKSGHFGGWHRFPDFGWTPFERQTPEIPKSKACRSLDLQWLYIGRETIRPTEGQDDFEPRWTRA